MASRYDQLIETIFFSHHKPGLTEFSFKRDELEDAAEKLGIAPPKNLGDVIYTFRYRKKLPVAVRDAAPAGREWIIRPAGKGQYRFVAVSPTALVPTTMMAETKIPDATPEVIAKYSLNDEQALLAVLRYNRLIDIFTGVTCYSLQNHLRTTVPGIGQIETDEVYLGIDRRGVHFVFPVQAKGGKDKLNVVQIEQDFAMATHKFPGAICRCIGAQFVRSGLIALFELSQNGGGDLAIEREKHYRLVAGEDVTTEDLAHYGKSLE